MRRSGRRGDLRRRRALLGVDASLRAACRARRRTVVRLVRGDGRRPRGVRGPPPVPRRACRRLDGHDGYDGAVREALVAHKEHGRLGLRTAARGGARPTAVAAACARGRCRRGSRALVPVAVVPGPRPRPRRRPRAASWPTCAAGLLRRAGLDARVRRALVPVRRRRRPGRDSGVRHARPTCGAPGAPAAGRGPAGARSSSSTTWSPPGRRWPRRRGRCGPGAAGRSVLPWWPRRGRRAVDLPGMRSTAERESGQLESTRHRARRGPTASVGPWHPPGSVVASLRGSGRRSPWQADASRRRNGPRKATLRRPITVRLRSKSCPDGGPDAVRPGRRGVVALERREPLSRRMWGRRPGRPGGCRTARQHAESLHDSTTARAPAMAAALRWRGTVALPSGLCTSRKRR